MYHFNLKLILFQFQILQTQLLFSSGIKCKIKVLKFLVLKLKTAESEFNELEPRLKSAKKRFQLSTGLNLEKFNTILSHGFNFSSGSNSSNSEVINFYALKKIWPHIKKKIILTHFLKKNRES